MRHTKKLTMTAVNMFLNGSSFVNIKRELGVNSGQRAVYLGISFLNRKHKLNLERDRSSSISFFLSASDRNTISNLVRQELFEEDLSTADVEEAISEGPIFTMLTEIHQKRMELLKQFDGLNDAVLKLERHLKKQLD